MDREQEGKASFRDRLLPGTPEEIVRGYESLAERARESDFGFIEREVVVLDTETTGLSSQENELIEICAARICAGKVTERFDTFVHPTGPIPEEIVALTHITNAQVAHAPSASRPLPGSLSSCTARRSSRTTRRSTGRSWSAYQEDPW